MMATDSINIYSDPKNLKVLRDYISEKAEICSFTEKQKHDVILAVDEACANIMRHAYSGEKDKEIIVTVDCGQDALTVTLQDFGKKPDLKKLDNPPQEKLRQGGYGVIFIKHLMDEIDYDLSPEKGTILKLVKYNK